MKNLATRFKTNLKLAASITSQILTSNKVQVLICFIGGLSSFLPLFVGIQSHLEDTVLKRSLTSGYYFRDSSMATLTLALPILIDILLDLTTASFAKTKLKGMGCSDQNSPCCLNNIEKFMLLGGIISAPLTAFIPYDVPKLGLIFLCCKKYQIVIVTGIVMISLCRNNVKFWPVSYTIAFLVVLSTATTLSSFIRNSILQDIDDASNYKMELACSVFQWAPIALLIFCNIRWLANTLMLRWKTDKYSPSKPEKDRQSDSHVYFTTVWVLTSLFGMLLLIVLSGIYNTDDKIDAIGLLLNNFIFLSFELAVTVFLMRIVKSDVVQGLVRTLSSHLIFLHYLLQHFSSIISIFFHEHPFVFFNDFSIFIC